MKNKKTRSICVYTCTIYTYMHHQIPPKYDIPSWPSLGTLWKTRSKWEICVESAVFVVFQVLFSPFYEKHHVSYKKCHLSWKKNWTRSICVYTCTIYTYMLHFHHQIPPKYKIYLVSLPSVLYDTPGWNERFVFWISCFCCFSCAFYRRCWFLYKKYHISWKTRKPGQYVCIPVPFTHTCTTKYHQNMIYLVGLPLVLYERPGQNERSVLNQLFLLFSGAFHEKCTTFHRKSATFHENKQNHVNMCVYMYHLHIHTPHTLPNTTKI